MMFLNSQTGEDVIERIRELYRTAPLERAPIEIEIDIDMEVDCETARERARDPLERVLLSQSLEIDVRAVLGLASPADETVVLLRAEHIVHRRSLAILLTHALTAASLIAAAGAALLH